MQDLVFPDGRWPSVSIILLTRNGLPEVAECLAQIQGQDYPGAVEIVHIDTDSSDGTAEAVAALGLKTHRIRPAAFHHGATRNLGMSLAGNDIVVFLSQDAIPQGAGWLRALVAPFSDVRVAGVYGRQEAPADVGPLRRYGLEYTYPQTREVRDPAVIERRSVATFRFSNANSALRRSIGQSIGFNEAAALCEDQIMCRALLDGGHVVVYEPLAAVWHAHVRSLREEFQWAADNGAALKRAGILGDPRVGGELRYGLKRMKDEALHFLARGRVDLAVYGFVVSVAKWLGVQAGKRADSMPPALAAWVAPSLRRRGGA